MKSSRLFRPWRKTVRSKGYNLFDYEHVCEDHYHDSLILRKREYPNQLRLYDVKKKIFQSLPNHPGKYFKIVYVDGFLYSLKYHYRVGILSRLDLSKRLKWERVDIPERDYFNILPCGRTLLLVPNEDVGLEEYDPSTGICMRRPELNDKVFVSCNLKTLTVNGKLYIFSIICHDFIDKAYDISTWSPYDVPCLPKEIVRSHVCIYKQRYIVIFGMTYSTYMKCDLLYDTITQQWHEFKCHHRIPIRQNPCVEVRDEFAIIFDKFGLCVVNISFLLPKWYIVNHWILLRHLMDTGRAHLIQEHDHHGSNKNNSVVLFQKIIVDLDIFLFRQVLLFL